ncbi:hypothetical protein GH714_006198 [Hevea brasiliensis]|uniref:Disease resistance N-terminal domain-containing protein n=1 Tax=Hevea brasiliensis TaxID=3981 RepID=A0A6A6N8T9_HEVBR|nr:hypothetical protein GH714_006198 [Hevea brasiliensis]
MAIGIRVESILSKLNELVSQEADLLSGVEEQVEFMEKELRMMYAVLQDVEASEGLSDYLLHWNEIVETANLNADNAIEKFITSRGNKSGLFVFQHLIDRHQVGMQLNRIKASIREMPHGSIWDKMVENVNLKADNTVDSFFASAGRTSSLLLFFQHLIERNQAIMQLNLIMASFRDNDMGRSIKAMHSVDHISYCGEFLILESIRVTCCRILLPIFLGERYEQALWKSVYNQVDSIKKDLSFIETLPEDVEGMEEDLALREKIWVLEMKDVAVHVKALDDLVLRHQPERKGVFNNMMSRRKVSKEIDQIKRKIAELNRKKRIYDIEISVPNRGQKSIAQDWQDKESSIFHTCNIINMEEQAQPSSSNHGATKKMIIHVSWRF